MPLSDTRIPQRDRDDLVIRQLWKTKTDGEMAAILGRTKSSVQHRRIALGLVREQVYHWTTEEDAAIREVISRSGYISELVDRFGHHRSDWSMRAKHLGLTFRKMRGNTYRGYIYTGHSGGRRIFKHVSVMEKKIGRKLQPGEAVHHINLDKSDNTEGNLYLCKNRAEHIRIHMQLSRFIPELFRRGLICFDGSIGLYSLSKKASA